MRRVETCTVAKHKRLAVACQHEHQHVCTGPHLEPGRTESALKGEPLARETTTKTDENNSLLAQPHERFFSSLVFDTVAIGLAATGISTHPLRHLMRCADRAD